MGYEINIETGMVTLDGEPVGRVEDLLATLTKDEVNADELATCYAVATKLRETALAYVAAEIARLHDPVRWNTDDVERAAEANYRRKLFEREVRLRTAEKLAAAPVEEVAEP